MKSLNKVALALLFCLTATAGFTQHSSKPALFGNYPPIINCSAFEFNNALAAAEGQHVVLFFSDNFKFSGTVISNVVKYSNLQSITIKSDQMENTIFHLSRQQLDGDNVSFVGRIISPNANDGYEIKKDTAGNYKLEKIEASKILQECNL
ncbi:MAG: hypothetical protein ABIO04_14435 [Ferruginibacter sp.]